MVLKPLLDLFPLNCTSKNLVADHNYEHTNYYLTTSYALSLILKIVYLYPKTLYISIPSPIDSTLLSKII